MLKRTLLAGLLLLVPVLPLRAEVVPRPELDENHRITLEVRTPHTKWAKPYVKGTARMLFFVNSSGASSLKPRECAELMQRFDLEAEAVFYARIVDTARTGLHGGPEGEKRVDDLLEEHWDVFVFFEIMPDILPDELQYKLFSRVAGGAGIVFAGVFDERVLKDKNRLADTPDFLRSDYIQEAYTAGEGRAVLTTQQPLFSYYEGWETDYDHWQEALGRAVLWAAGKAPGAWIKLDILSRGGERGLKAVLGGDDSAEGTELTIKVKNRINTKGAYSVESVITGEEYFFVLPALPEGEYYADATASAGGEIITWRSEKFFVPSARFIRRVELDRGWGESGWDIGGRAVLVGAPLEDETIRFNLMDPHRRILDFIQIDDVNGRHPEFSFSTDENMPMLLTVEAVLSSAGATVSRDYSYYSHTRRNRGKYNFMMWDSPAGTLAPYAIRRLAESGITIQLSRANPGPSSAAYNISWIPYATRIRTFIDAIPDDSKWKSMGMSFCWSDMESAEKDASRTAARYRRSREHGVFAYSLGDEIITQGACLSPHCLAAYREYLRGIYLSVENLNESWSSGYGHWDEIELSDASEATEEDYLDYMKATYSRRKLALKWFYSTDDFPDLPFNRDFYKNDEGPAWKAGNYSRWYDRQAFKSYTLAKLIRVYAEAFSAMDPRAITGFEGAGRFELGDDIDLILRNTGWWGPYPDTADEIIRSLAPADYPRGNWMGYRKDADSLLSVYWRMVMRGMDMPSWWRWNGIGRFRGWLAPDLRLFPGSAGVYEDTRMMRDGLGDLLMRSAMQDDGIAVLFSHPSYYARQLENGPAWGSLQDAHNALHTAIRELGLQFSYVTDRMLRLGEFDPSKYRVLILPAAEALGSLEAAVIEDFALSGGTVVADVRPGLYDDRCRMLDSGILDGLFGIAREGSPPPAVEAVPLAGGAEMEGVKVDPGVMLSGAEAGGFAGGAPVMIEKKIGRGKAVLLNFSFSSVPSLRARGTPEELADYFLRVFEQAGVTPAVRVLDAAGSRMKNLEVVRWKTGSVEIAALFRQGGSDETARVELKAPMHVYALREGKYTGRVKGFDASVRRNRAGFYVLYPREAPAPSLALPALVRPGGRAEANIAVPGMEGARAFSVRVDSGGVPMPWHSRVVLTEEEGVRFVIPIAHNDPAGIYSVTLKDLFTGGLLTETFTVKP